MNNESKARAEHPLELWGGLECTVNRVRDQYFSQMDRNGHLERLDDLERFAALGIRMIRYPVLWEKVAPDGVEQADWSWTERLSKLKQLGVEPIAGLVHHGSGPAHTSLVSPCFAEKLAEYAGALARHCPWIKYYTPVNEPLTTARFSALYGVWYPHAKDDRTFVQAVLNQCRATVLAMREIRKVRPDAQLVQTDDLGKTYATPELEQHANFYNERRWLAWDFLCGRVDQDHAMWTYLVETGIDEAELLWFRDNPCPPDIIGVNYYVTSERWLDHRLERYPEHCRGAIFDTPVADIETARALATPTPGIAPLLQEAWERYGLPIAVTEAHLDCHREDQMRWLLEIWDGALQARANGADVRAVTVWSLLGSFDWNCLVTECRGYYEPGPLDVRSSPPRPTALARLMRELSAGLPLSHQVLRGKGWWRRSDRFLCPPVATRNAPTSISADGHHLVGTHMQPILITGATGTLGRAFARLCERRNIAYRLMSRQDMDIADPVSVENALAKYQPWAVVNASGYVRVDEAQNDAERCFRENTVGPAVLADVCARHDIHLLTFSSDLVFDGERASPYVESDSVRPLNVYGESKARAEKEVLDRLPSALVVRTSSFFGPWDQYNFITQSLRTLAAGEPLYAARDITVSPTYVPDLVNVCLDLLVDKASGIWHLTNGEPVTWADFALKAAELSGMDASRLEPIASEQCNFLAPRPSFSALHSERAILLPKLDDALSRYLNQCEVEPAGAPVRGELLGDLQRRVVAIAHP
ncbi:NAD-dependent epimerase/dehydratase family protein [Massilia arenosa]|uniref:dTDP-4-dehydrorhamnose reductase n=1 Tax=Zemynaea arenosa TaxID=2561931 RepID=A0A4Y9SX82_9BURK|nr:family 1 glycosylhydrolase [Massilia arenosa]TFW29253.1 NAD-dependent epimerase/dehydratase family protein [Massilia arenosa]